MELTQLDYFLTVARLQHMTRASEALSITQPALSQAIAKLESELGVPLFERKGRNVQLNRYGRLFAAKVDRAMRELEDGRQQLNELSNPEAGLISFAFLNILGADLVPKLIRDYRALYPKARFEMEQGSHAFLNASLDNGERDFIITSSRRAAPQYEWQPLLTAPLYIVVSAGHRFAGASSLSLKKLASESYIGLKNSCGLKATLESCFVRSGTVLTASYEAEDLTTVAGFVAAGLGISLMPRTAGLALEGLVWLPVEESGWIWEVGLQWRKEQYLSPAVESFIAFAKEEVHS